MDFQDEKEFLKRNDIIANKRVRNVLSCCTLVGPLLAIGKWLDVFEADYIYCAVLTLIAVVEFIIQYYLCENEKYYNIAKYSGLVGVQIIIGLVGTKSTIGVYMTYGFMPILSCMYFDSKLTRNISMFSYAIMVGALYFRSFGAVIRDYSTYTHMQWFISQLMGFTIEYILIGIGVYSLAKYEKGILNSSYREGKAKFYTEEANKVKNAFLANISDELRMPIGKIIQNCESLQHEENLSEVASTKLKELTQVGEVLYSTIDDMIDFSNLQLERVTIKEEKYQISQLIDDVKRAICKRIGERNIDFNLIINPSLPNELLGDEVRIRQMLITLLKHTVKFMDEGFIILRIDWKRQEEKAILNIDVMDTGISISEEDFNRLFDDFWEAHESKFDLLDELGVGLPICRRLCERMNGSISVSNQYGKGSVFNVILPQKIANDNIIYSDVKK